MVMNKSSKAALAVLAFLVCSIIANAGLFSANALYQPFPKIRFEADNWTQDMKRVKMTTLERGLKIRIDFTNLDTQNYYTIPYIRIRIETLYEEQNYRDSNYVELRNYAIPPNNVTSTYYDVDLHRSPSSIGKWSVRLTYVTNENSWDFFNQIEPYPFEFKVASEGQLQKTIEENPSFPIINIVVPITLSGGSITIVAWTLLNRKKKRGH